MALPTDGARKDRSRRPLPWRSKRLARVETRRPSPSPQRATRRFSHSVVACGDNSVKQTARLASYPSRPYLYPAMLQPLLVAERPQTDIEKPFRLSSEFRPAGDQPQAIDELCEGLARGERDQVLLGVTGSGKTFTMAHVIARTGRPAIVLAPNKTLAAQLYGEMKSFFPENAVEYFVSYYDYYQPEAYVPRTDTYVEKESSLNEQIDRMRHAATRAILERRDVAAVASVSCIYGIGSVETYSKMTETVTAGEKINRNKLLSKLVELQYRRNDTNFVRGTFRVRGDTIEIFPAHYEDRAWRVSLFGDEVEGIHEIDPLTGEKITALQSIKVYANSHYVTPRPTLLQA